MNIAIMGTGRVAQTLAPRWAAAGHDIVLGSREPASKSLDFPTATFSDAVKGADVVVNATPGASSLQTLTDIGPDVFDGKVVIDLANAVTPAFELMYPNSSLGEQLQTALATAKIVKTMNTAAMTVMANPSAIGPSTVFMSGDEDAAKEVVGSLLADLGWSKEAIVDLGGIQSARGVEHYFLLFAALLRSQGAPTFNILLVQGQA
jgi:8-hydroxy-5-deazaflavin:NADPH oxidoreductase